MAFYGDEVRIIHAVWIKNESGLLSTNIDKVNELTSQGVSLADAILQAWTVTRAAKWGFSKVRVLGSPAGTLGAFIKLDVLIEKKS